VLGGLVPGEGPVCAVLAGGNIDATTLMSVTRFGLTSSGRYLVIRIVIPDRPGQLANIVGVIAAERANVLAVTHYREGRSIGVLETEAELTLETRGEGHSQLLVEALVTAGFTVRRLR
jgi:threonine dehydratase